MRSKLLLIIVWMTTTVCAASAYAGDFDYRYTARVGDINGDGLQDYYLQHRPNTAIIPLDDISVPVPLSRTVARYFALMGESSGGFSVASSLSSTQRNTMAGWPTVTVGVTNGDFNGDGALDLYVSGLRANATQHDYREIVIYAPSATAQMQVADGLVARTYYVRRGDINNDGLSDLFVTGNSTRFVSDFLLQQVSWGTNCAECKAFGVQTLTSSQAMTASTWPVEKSITIFREDLNFDGYYDFYLEGLDTTIPYADDVIVYTRRNVGTTAAKAVEVDQYFNRVAADVAQAIGGGLEYIEEFYNQTCYYRYSGQPPSYNPLAYVDYDWLYTGDPDEWYRDTFIDFYGDPASLFSNGFASDADARVCYPHGAAKGPHVQRLVRSLGDYISLGGPDCSDCTEHALAALSATAVVVDSAVQIPRAARVARWAWVLTGILIADDATVVGTVDDVLIPVTILVAGVAELVLIVSNNSHPEAGPRNSPPPAKTERDAYAEPPGYDPNDPDNRDNERKAGPNGKGDSGRLGENMTRGGNPKPHPDAQAHHIGRKGGQTELSQVQQNNIQRIRELFRRNDIDIDTRANGVWLPKNPDAARAAGTRAVSHSEIHAKQALYDERVLSRLEAAELAGGREAVLVELRSIAGELLTNTFRFVP